MKHKKIILGIAAALSVALVFSSAGLKPKQADGGILFNNINTKIQQNQLKTIMDNRGLKDNKEFFQRVGKFNGALSKNAGIVAASVKVEKKNYNTSIIYKNIMKKYPEEKDWNCRLTVFSLMKDYIEAPAMGEAGNYLMFDLDYIENEKKFSQLKADENKFIALFDEISVDGMSEEQLVKAYPEALEKRGVKYLNKRVSIISAVLHDPDEKALFVGHTGLLFKTKNYYFFLEKLAPYEPYELTRYKTKKQLKETLENRVEYSDAAAHKPIILENNKLL